MLYLTAMWSFKENVNTQKVLLLTALLLSSCLSALFVTRFVLPLVLPVSSPTPRFVGGLTNGPALPAQVGLPPAPAAEVAPPSSVAPTEEESLPPSTPNVSSREQQHPRSQGDIVRVGPGSYVISREAVNKALSQKGGFGVARAILVSEQGSIIGYRLQGVSGTARKLGLRSGDIITSVNGRKINSPDSAIAAYGGLGKVKNARVVVRRGGRPVTLSYRFN